ncbi:endonuclease-reverse transcriptase [Elysia marginata]|uniref:Endonuclease-reverse transcriptase n=1 Tax=Elysia marginata TaxID=1093978 RepID=A0AAV4GJD1_9GAST|nr:endonuclease-reverse transcriptase [Elysia marginata]
MLVMRCATLHPVTPSVETVDVEMIKELTVVYCDKVKSFDMWCYRRVLRISWKEHKTNEEVGLLQAADVTERLLDQLIKKKLRYAGYVIGGARDIFSS